MTICWYNSLSVKNICSLQKIAHICSKITGVSKTDLSHFCLQQTLQKAPLILSEKDHIVYKEFLPLPSGPRFRYPKFKKKKKRREREKREREREREKKERLKDSFVAAAMCILNDI